MERTKNLVYTCKQTFVDLIDGNYAKGVQPGTETLSTIQRCITRYAELGEPDVSIEPEEVSSYVLLFLPVKNQAATSPDGNSYGYEE